VSSVSAGGGFTDQNDQADENDGTDSVSPDIVAPRPLNQHRIGN
jgi:hypothetical protein